MTCNISPIYIYLSVIDLTSIHRDHQRPGGVVADLDGGPGHVRAPRHHAAHGEAALVQRQARAARPRPGARL